MCGLLGYVSFLNESKSRNYQNAIKKIKHRGPDDQGFYYWNPQNSKLTKEIDNDFPHKLFLGHVRLSILDLSDAGWQPMRTRDNRYFIIFNGEIYNYLELRNELEKIGHQFYSHTDTEVLLNAFIQWGKECLNKLTGMFAFCVFDSQDKKIFLARDFFGIKPLYFSFNKEFFVFSSEINPLFEMEKIKKDINSDVLSEFLKFGSTDISEKTLYQNIIQLPSAHYLDIDISDANYYQKLSPIKYWHINKIDPIEIDFNDAKKRVRELFLENIMLHMRSDVSIGAALSGGIDSSAIVMAMRYLNPKSDLHTFSFISEDELTSEEKWVDIIGDAAKTNMHKISPSSFDLAEELDILIHSQELPFGSASIFAQRKVMNMAQQNGIKVMLDGQGADEIFAGYNPYSTARIASLIKQFHFLSASRFKRKLISLPNRRTSWAQVCEYLIPIQMKFLIPTLRLLAGKKTFPEWLNRKWFLERNVHIQSSFNKSHSKYVLRDELIQTMTKTSLPNLLRYEDRNSMACSIESRVPFLTHELAEFVFSLPEKYLINEQGTTKYIFREAMRGIVPHQILERKDKIGFHVPEQKWFSSLRPWVSTRLNNKSIESIPALNHKIVISMRNDFLNGIRPFDPSLWKILNIIRWVEINQASFS
ncbi:asparagine synthase (glutamine-hydrolyzing) [Fluviispira sanaruensis]|uniref:asparagine synthase (glutamine-hydrolyzing) n=1 Tax=Fluviispira sanaruensis TaxID=2493639 RepID=A0A4P2VPA2_FLUSA|nr:asparagine synthase (glutamine-hydrolyzing) [Fluviispira sanaruensis]BBH54054.1 asparagine synthase (glutamine-hydrolyzing) [Fluviispira sanaruensis]